MSQYRIELCWYVPLSGLLTLVAGAGCRAPNSLAPSAQDPLQGPPFVQSEPNAAQAHKDVTTDKPQPQERAISAAAAPVTLEPRTYPGSANDGRRMQLALELAGEEGWNLYATEHFFVATPIIDPLLIEGAKRRIEALRAKLEQDFPPVNRSGPMALSLLRILPSRAEFLARGGQPGSSAFWLPSSHTLVCYDGGSEAERRRETWPALQHVLVHEYFGELLGIDPMPPWLLYGLATRYESLEFERASSGGRWLPADKDVLDRRLRQVTAGGVPVSLTRLLAFDSGEFHGVNEFGSSAYSNLVLAGSFVRFVKEASEPLGGLPEGFLEHYCTSLQAGMNQGAALMGALQGSPLGPVDAAWRSWIEERTGRQLPLAEE